MMIFGLRGFTHGGANVLTVMSADGVTAALKTVATGDDVIVNAAPGRLTQYIEKRGGALGRLIEDHDIVLLSKDAWDKKKAELGDTVFR